MKAITEEIKKVVDLQEELDIDVLVHGEPEVGKLPAYLTSIRVLHLFCLYAHTYIRNLRFSKFEHLMYAEGRYG